MFALYDFCFYRTNLSTLNFGLLETKESLICIFLQTSQYPIGLGHCIILKLPFKETPSSVLFTYLGSIVSHKYFNFQSNRLPDCPVQLSCYCTAVVCWLSYSSVPSSWNSYFFHQCVKLCFCLTSLIDVLTGPKKIKKH